MNTAIIGAGAVGEALARAFARKGIHVAIASRRPPEVHEALVKAIGPKVVAKSLNEALLADTIVLAVPFRSHTDVAKALASWQGKIVIDATNAYGIPSEDLGDRPSSVVISEALQGARLVKAFNHLPANVLAADPAVQGGRRVVFLSSDDNEAARLVAGLAEQLGFAPVKLGGLAEGGLLVQARGSAWAPLIFQDLVKFG